ncbi:hypothetical protein Leryth_015240 [Lithospermum erythrorhizon]|nr:hypothetical protein Leryth_015240 [Lithospermum erythrorhizon]
MGRTLKLRDLIGVIKDKASISKATLLSKPNTLPLHLALLRITTHSISSPLDDHNISYLLTLGNASRATASSVIAALMDRLHRTTDSSVALKCLIIIHHIVKRGPFILQDQLSIFPTTGGYNYLKLSSFKDNATSATWALSAWVRFHARYLETVLSCSRNLGYFVCSSSCNMERDKLEEKISSFLNVFLVQELDSLVGLVEELCKLPYGFIIEGNKLMYEIMVLLNNDYLSIINEVVVRLAELKTRLSLLSFGESVELMCGFKRLEDCKEKLFDLFSVRKPSIEMLWSLIDELKDEIGELKVYEDGGRLGLLTLGGKEKASESARFGGRVDRRFDSVQFSSARFDMNEHYLMII